MKATLVFVPPNGGEADYQLDFDLPDVPQPGDYVSITRGKIKGTSDFIVRRTWWHLDYPSDALYKDPSDTTAGRVKTLVVECEFARGPNSSDPHKQSCQMYESRKGAVKEFEASAY